MIKSFKVFRLKMINNNMIEQNQLLIKILIGCTLMTLGFFISVIKEIVLRTAITLQHRL